MMRRPAFCLITLWVCISKFSELPGQRYIMVDISLVKGSMSHRNLGKQRGSGEEVALGSCRRPVGPALSDLGWVGGGGVP